MSMKIEEIKNSSTKDKRVSSHSHIKGLGLNEYGSVVDNSAGFIGQAEAREVRNQCMYNKNANLCSFCRPPVMLSIWLKARKWLARHYLLQVHQVQAKQP